MANEIVHLVGTYNISFAPDAGYDPNNSAHQFASETTFAKGRLKSDDIREFYDNAIKRVETIFDEPDFSVIGLQEINDTADKRNPAHPENPKYIPGTKVLGEKKLKEIVETYTQKQLELSFDSSVEKEGSGEGIAIIWNKTKLGTEIAHKLVNMRHPINEEGYEKDPNKDSRPMLMVLTDKNYLLVNCHARNDPGASARTMKDIANFISENSLKFLEENNKSKEEQNEILRKTFIMGDFNDRFDGLQQIEVANETFKYEGKAPRSCCYNRDSSCIEEKFYTRTKILAILNNKKNLPANIRNQLKQITNSNATDLELQGMLKQLGRSPGKALDFLKRENVGLCDGDPNAPKSSMSIDNDRNGDTNAAGDIASYRYYGDKIFGINPSGKLEIYPNYDSARINAPSRESDHEMVIGRFITEGSDEVDIGKEREREEVEVEGGRRRRKYKKNKTTKRRNNRKSNKRHSRKHPRKTHQGKSLKKRHYRTRR